MHEPPPTTTAATAALDTAERGLRLAARALLDLALPPRCAVCSAIVSDDGGFCLACWRSLTFLVGPACARCDRPFAQVQADGALCGGCIADPPPYARVHAPLAYGPHSRQVVLRLKYGRRTGMARLMARLMAGRIAPVGPDPATTAEAAAEATDAPVLVPVPLHRWRLWSRGFNQSAEVARHLARTTGHALAVDALVRHRQTPVLRGMGRTARARTLRGAFTVPDHRRPAIAGRTVFLIDDVFTTGSTTAACARTLLRAGARRVEVVAFARVVADIPGEFDRDYDGDPAAIIDSMPTPSNI